MKALGRDSVLSGRDCGLTVNQSGRYLAPDGVSPITLTIPQYPRSEQSFLKPASRHDAK